MSPFGNYLRELRVQRGLRQIDAADLLGYEQSYLSALESGAKGPANPIFVEKVVSKYQLNQLECAKLKEACDCSKRRRVLPKLTSLEEYEVANLFLSKLGNLTGSQIQMISLILNS